MSLPNLGSDIWRVTIAETIGFASRAIGSIGGRVVDVVVETCRVVDDAVALVVGTSPEAS